MPSSMTGFGTGRAEVDGCRLVVEVRSVNHRYLDIRWHVFGDVEIDRADLESRLRRSLHRGHVDIRVQLDVGEGARERLEIDELAVAELLRNATSISERHGLEPPSRLRDLLAVPGVVRRRVASVDRSHGEQLAGAFEDALRELESMRQREGATTTVELQRHLQSVERIAGDIDARCRPGVADRMERMKRRLQQLLEGHSVDEHRLLQEAAVLADREDITEELERLSSHLAQMRILLGSTEPVGRRIDFLLQEMNREANTIGSKSSDVDVAHLVVELKAEIEKLREQSQNIE